MSGLAGCGAPASDPAPGLDSRTTATRGSAVGAQGTAPASDVGVRAGGDRSGQSGQPAAGQPAMAAGTTDERHDAPDPNIPDTIAKNLISPDALVRYRALDHWESKDNKVSLDPVFDAMEDEDPAVRAKATAIVEQYWAVEQGNE